MSEEVSNELDRLIKHLRRRPQQCSEVIGDYRREFKSDDCVAADHLERLRAELEEMRAALEYWIPDAIPIPHGTDYLSQNVHKRWYATRALLAKHQPNPKE